MLRPYNKAEVAFEIVKEIGADGQNSRTYVSRDHQLDAEIVMKQIAKSTLDSPANFFDESKALYASAHPNVVQIHYACQDDDYIYLAMPYYRKGSVTGLITNQHMTVREVASIGCQVLSGLHNIHSKKLIHFDVKPDNKFRLPSLANTRTHRGRSPKASETDLSHWCLPSPGGGPDLRGSDHTML